MEDQPNQVSKEIDTVEQMCLDMQQTHEDQENDKKRRQFQASIWQHLGKYVLISYKDETYTNVGKLDKIEQDKDRKHEDHNHDLESNEQESIH
jgi:hypothetical protein